MVKSMEVTAIRSSPRRWMFLGWFETSAQLWLLTFGNLAVARRSASRGRAHELSQGELAPHERAVSGEA